MPRVSADRMDATRRQILSGARRAFARHGFEGATVRVLEQEIGLSRGAIFHHFRDKDALFLALAAEDADEIADAVASGGLVDVMRALPAKDAGWLGVQLEISRRLGVDPEFRARWTAHLDTVRRAAEERLARGRAAGAVRDDVPTAALTTFLTLVHDGLVLHLATGMPPADVAGALDLAEEAVRSHPASRPASTAPSSVGEDLPHPENDRRPVDDS